MLNLNCGTLQGSYKPPIHEDLTLKNNFESFQKLNSISTEDELIYSMLEELKKTDGSEFISCLILKLKSYPNFSFSYLMHEFFNRALEPNNFECTHEKLHSFFEAIIRHINNENFIPNLIHEDLTQNTILIYYAIFYCILKNKTLCNRFTILKENKSNLKKYQDAFFAIYLISKNHSISIQRPHTLFKNADNFTFNEKSSLVLFNFFTDTSSAGQEIIKTYYKDSDINIKCALISNAIAACIHSYYQYSLIYNESKFQHFKKNDALLSNYRNIKINKNNSKSKILRQSSESLLNEGFPVQPIAVNRNKPNQILSENIQTFTNYELINYIDKILYSNNDHILSYIPSLIEGIDKNKIIPSETKLQYLAHIIQIIELGLIKEGPLAKYFYNQQSLLNVILSDLIFMLIGYESLNIKKFMSSSQPFLSGAISWFSFSAFAYISGVAVKKFHVTLNSSNSDEIIIRNIREISKNFKQNTPLKKIPQGSALYSLSFKVIEECKTNEDRFDCLLNLYKSKYEKKFSQKNFNEVLTVFEKYIQKTLNNLHKKNTQEEKKKLNILKIHIFLYQFIEEYSPTSTNLLLLLKDTINENIEFALTNNSTHELTIHLLMILGRGLTASIWGGFSNSINANSANTENILTNIIYLILFSNLRIFSYKTLSNFKSKLEKMTFMNAVKNFINPSSLKSIRLNLPYTLITGTFCSIGAILNTVYFYDKTMVTGFATTVLQTIADSNFTLYLSNKFNHPEVDTNPVITDILSQLNQLSNQTERISFNISIGSDEETFNEIFNFNSVAQKDEELVSC